MSVKDETHENIDNEFNEDDLYEIDKLILDENKWRKPVFESEINIYICYKETELYELYTW